MSKKITKKNARTGRPKGVADLKQCGSLLAKARDTVDKAQAKFEKYLEQQEAVE